MAYNTTDHVYYLKQYSEIKDEFTEQNLVSFLNDVLEGRAKVISRKRISSIGNGFI